MWWKFQFNRNFGFAIATLQIFQHPENVKISIFPSHCPSRNAISSKVFNDFSKTFFGRTMRNVAIVVENFNSTEILVCNSNATNFPTSWICKNFYFSLYTVPSEMLYLQKYLTNFQKLFLAEWWGRWLLWLKISSAQIFWFCNTTV